MNFEKTDIPDIILYKPKILKDGRGYFVETMMLREKIIEILDGK